MKKTLMFVLMFVVCFLVMPTAFADGEVTYPTVTDITKPDTLRGGKITLSEIVDGTLTVTVEDAEFKLLGEGEHSENRPDNKAWVGLHFAFPSEGTSNWKFDEGQPYGNYEFDEYFGFDVEALKTAAIAKKNLEKSWDLTWKAGETTNTLTVKLVVKPESVVLLDKTEENKEDWNEAEYLKESKQVKLLVVVTKSQKDSGEVEPAKSYYYDEGTKVDKKELLAKLGVGSKYTLKGIYADETRKTAFDFSKPLTENTTIYVDYVLKAKDETNPATGDNLLTYVSLSVIALTGALGTGLYLKKVNE